MDRAPMHACIHPAALFTRRERGMLGVFSALAGCPSSVRLETLQMVLQICADESLKQNLAADANFNVSVMTELSSVGGGDIKKGPSLGAVIY